MGTPVGEGDRQGGEKRKMQLGKFTQQKLGLERRRSMSRGVEGGMGKRKRRGWWSGGET